jgi:hypothetical protein
MIPAILMCLLFVLDLLGPTAQGRVAWLQGIQTETPAESGFWCAVMKHIRLPDLTTS